MLIIKIKYVLSIYSVVSRIDLVSMWLQNIDYFNVSKLLVFYFLS